MKELEHAGAIPEVWLTAYQVHVRLHACIAWEVTHGCCLGQLIHLVGETKPGDVVLVHAAGS